LKKLFGSIEERCQELAAWKLQGKQEVELLIEIEEFRERLAFLDQSIKNIGENPNMGLASAE
jgi:hypothetical protein